MNHQNGLFAMAAATATSAVISTTFAAETGTAAQPQQKPNLIFILMDDMGYSDLGAFGSEINRTPNLDRMAAEGMKLTSFYAASVCTPARAMLMTGCYPKRVDFARLLFPLAKEGISHSENTLPALLKKQGYSTAMFGKWHLGDQKETLPTNYGFEKYIGLPYSNDMCGSMKKGQGYPPLPLLDGDRVIEAPVEQDRLTGRLLDESIKFIRASHSEKKPFFIYLAHIAPHVPLHPGPDFRGRSKHGIYSDWIEEADWGVGKIMQTLKELEIDEHTLLVFTSDNGPWLSKGKDSGKAFPLRGGKGIILEGGVRVPFIARWPGKIPAGAKCDAVASLMDILPTFVRLAGGEIPYQPKIDGKDIWPLLSGNNGVSPSEAFYYWNGMTLAAVRQGAWKYLIQAQREEGTSKEEFGKIAKDFKPMLFNLDNDVGESTDVSALQPEIVEKMMALIEKMDKDLAINGKGPGVRPCLTVGAPKPLLGSPK